MVPEVVLVEGTPRPGFLRTSPEEDMGPRPCSGIFATRSRRACLEHPSWNGGGVPFPFHPPPPPSGHRPPPHLSASERLPAPAPAFSCYLCPRPAAGPAWQPRSLGGYPIIPLAQHGLPSSRPLAPGPPPPSLPAGWGLGRARHRPRRTAELAGAGLTHRPRHFLGGEAHHRPQVTRPLRPSHELKPRSRGLTPDLSSHARSALSRP